MIMRQRVFNINTDLL